MDIKLQSEVNNVTKDVIVFDLIVLAIVLVTSIFNKSMLLGLLFGTIIAVLNFRLLALTI